jgi:hypothetical protein
MITALTFSGDDHWPLPAPSKAGPSHPADLTDQIQEHAVLRCSTHLFGNSNRTSNLDTFAPGGLASEELELVGLE